MGHSGSGRQGIFGDPEKRDSNPLMCAAAQPVLSLSFFFFALAPLSILISRCLSPRSWTLFRPFLSRAASSGKADPRGPAGRAIIAAGT